MEVRIRGLRLYAFHGVLPQERMVGGEFEVNASLSVCADCRATEQDRLEGAVDYAVALRLIKEEMAQPSDLLERVCYRIAERLLMYSPLVARAAVEVCKVNPPLGERMDGASVYMVAERE